MISQSKVDVNLLAFFIIWPRDFNVESKWEQVERSGLYGWHRMVVE